VAPGRPGGRGSIFSNSGTEVETSDKGRAFKNRFRFGCTTCIGNSGPLPEEDFRQSINDNGIIGRAVRRVPQLRKARVQPRRAGQTMLASPPWWGLRAWRGNGDKESSPVEPIRQTAKDGKRGI